MSNSTEAEKAVLEVPEVTRVVSRIGRPEIATAPNGPDESDVYIFLRLKRSGMSVARIN